MIALNQTAVVYTENPGTGVFDVVANSALTCRLFHVSTQPAATGPDRDELAGRRNCHYDPSYTLPNGCQLLVDGQRWNPVHGTDGVIKPFNTVIQKRIDVVRAD